MSDRRNSENPNGDQQESVAVITAQGKRYEGWPIRDGAVLVAQSGLTQPLRVVIGSEEFTVEAIYENSPSLEGPVWSALQLPPGCLPIQGEVLPPWVDPSITEGDDDDGQAHRSVWCLLFPRLSGC